MRRPAMPTRGVERSALSRLSFTRRRKQRPRATTNGSQMAKRSRTDMKAISPVIFALLLVVLPSDAFAATGANFDEGWRFHNGDAPGAEQPAFDDSSWRRLNLPHD